MISAICPTYNEANYIKDIVEFFVSSKPLDKELLIIDGGSSDSTREIVKEFLTYHKNIFLIDNPGKYVSFALNIGIQKARGEIIVRLDAHTKYSSDYFEKIVESFIKSNADIVGGPYLTIYRNNFQNAVAKAISNPFGIGDSKAHDPNYEGYVDSVPYGAFKKNIFNKTGLFDERLVRNQDDEFNYRANSLGKKVYLNPDIKLWYYPRDSVLGLFKQYFQYGFYKPLVLKKINTGIKVRHLIPGLFVLYLFLLPLCTILNWIFIPLIVYIVLLLFTSGFTKENFKVKIYSLIIYPVIHLSYGFGFLLGLKNSAKKVSSK